MKENTGKTKYILLGLIAHSPQTGYSIKKKIEFELSHFWQESYGQIYPTLKQLIEEGLAEIADAADMVNGRGQKLYKITEAGREELKKWLSEAPDVEKLRYEILLKISFGDSTEPEVILKHLEDFMIRNDKYINEMNLFLQYFSNPNMHDVDHTYKELTVLCGKYVYTAMNEWAIEAKKILLDKKADHHETKNT